MCSPNLQNIEGSNHELSGPHLESRGRAIDSCVIPHRSDRGCRLENVPPLRLVPLPDARFSSGVIALLFGRVIDRLDDHPTRGDVPPRLLHPQDIARGTSLDFSRLRSPRAPGFATTAVPGASWLVGGFGRGGSKIKARSRRYLHIMWACLLWYVYSWTVSNFISHHERAFEDPGRGSMMRSGSHGEGEA